MTTLARRDLLGARQIFFDPTTGLHAADLRTLLAQVPAARTSGLDPLGIAAAWALTDAPDHTCLRAIRSIPPGGSLVSREGVHLISQGSPESRKREVQPGIAEQSQAPSSFRASELPCKSDLASLLPLAAKRALAAGRRPVVALAGGVDAPLAVLAARRAGVEIVDAIHLAVPGTSYDESVAARETAQALGLSLHEIRVTPEELAGELPRAVELAGTPLYNLHPVSRAIVARVAAARGHDVLLTGDGADQASRGATERADYVPVVAAITRGSELVLASPFVDDAVVQLLIEAEDPAKEGLRALAMEWGLPSAIAARPKVPRSAPPLPRAAFPTGNALAALSLALGRSITWSDDDRSNVGIASLAAFVTAFGVT